MMKVDADYYEVSMVAVVAPRPTRWDVLVLGLLWAGLILIAVMQYHVMGEARRYEEIPVIVVTATPAGMVEGE